MDINYRYNIYNKRTEKDTYNVKKEDIDSDPSNKSVIRIKPKYPHYALIEKRLTSFRKWSISEIVKPEDLADAGFVFTGIGDSVRCFYCGGGLREFVNGDDPWIEHVKWYQNCPYILLVKGQSFINNVGKTKSDQDTTAEKTAIKSSAELSCLQMGFDEPLVQTAIKRYKHEHKNSNFSGVELAELCDALKNDNRTTRNKRNSTSQTYENVETQTLENDIQDDIEILLQENRQLKDEMACKICLDHAASVIFIKCGHLSTCGKCAPAFKNCPMCRTPVEGFLKASLV